MTIERKICSKTGSLLPKLLFLERIFLSLNTSNIRYMSDIENLLGEYNISYDFVIENFSVEKISITYVIIETFSVELKSVIYLTSKFHRVNVN